MTEFGSMALIDEGAGDEDGVAIALPGVKRGNSALKTSVSNLSLLFKLALWDRRFLL